jgi:hypothetical protein
MFSAKAPSGSVDIRNPLIDGAAPGLEDDAVKALFMGVPALRELSPAIGDEIVAALKALPADKRTRAMTCVEAMSKMEREGDSAPLPDFQLEDLTIALDLYKGLPTPTRQAVVQQVQQHVPAEAKPLVPLVDKMPSDSVARMAPLVRQICDETDKNEPLDALAVAKLHAEFVKLPEQVKRGVVQALPEEGRKMAVHILDVTDGMTENDVVELLTEMGPEVGPCGARC